MQSLQKENYITHIHLAGYFFQQCLLPLYSHEPPQKAIYHLNVTFFV